MLGDPTEFSRSDPRVAEFWANLSRSMTPDQRMSMAFKLTDLFIEMQGSVIRADYPHASEREVLLRAAALRIPRDLMIRAFGWDPEQEYDPAVLERQAESRGLTPPP
jgi:hypothetical protein